MFPHYFDRAAGDWFGEPCIRHDSSRCYSHMRNKKVTLLVKRDLFEYKARFSWDFSDRGFDGRESLSGNFFLVILLIPATHQ